MEGTCNECVFPLSKENKEMTDLCPTDTPLTYAVKVGKLSCVNELIAAGADVNVICTCHGSGALIAAASRGRVECLKLLIAAGADVNIKTYNGYTALMCATDTQCMIELITAGADVNMGDNKGNTALMHALMKGNVNCAIVICSAGADVNASNIDKVNSLMIAASGGNTECLKELIAAGAAINERDKFGDTALIYAASKNHVACLKELISARADVNKQDKDGQTALMLATWHGHTNCVIDLLKSGADQKYRMIPNWQTALMLAAIRGNVECLKELTATGAEVNKGDINGKTALVWAATNGHVECLKLLIAAKVKVNKQDEDGRTALMHAALKGRSEHLKELLKGGANVNSSDNDGNTTLIRSAYLGFEAIVQLLLQNGADVNSENNDGETALYLSVNCGHRDFDRTHERESDEEQVPWSVYARITYTLIEAGASLNETSSGLNLSTAHLKPVKLRNPDLHILKILKAAGANIEELMVQTSPKPLKDLVRDNIRKYLKQVHPLKNLFITIPQLGLPFSLKSYLLYYALHDFLCKEDILQKSAEGNLESVLNLIEAGVDVNVQDERGMTALMMAAEIGDELLIEELIRAGGNVNIKNILGDTALICTTNKEQIECVQQLLDHGANVSIQGHDGNTALVTAVTMKSEPCLNLLLQHRADPNISNDSGLTPLAIGARNGFDCTDELIRARADVNSLDKHGSTPIICAGFYGRITMVRKLIEAGADVNHTALHFSALMAAALKGHTDCIQELIRAGADLNFADKRSKTALMFAIEGNSDACVTALMKAGAEINIEVLAEEARKYYFSKVSNVLHSSRIKTENILRRFFKAGGIPDVAKYPEDVAILKQFGWKSPLKLSTLCKRNFNADVLIPLLSGCPMTIVKKGRRYLATVSRGETTGLQGDKSDVRLETREGCPKSAYLMEIRTDLSNFGSIIPDDECFISPIVEVLAPAKTNISSFLLRIPHCLDEDDDRTKVKVRMIHENRNAAVVEVPKGNAGTLYYTINARFIELHTTHFCMVICTICQTPYHCRGRITSFWFARFDTQEGSKTLHDVQIRPYFGAVLHTIEDFKESVEATLNLRYVTQGSLKKSRSKFNPEAGQIMFSLKVPDSAWKPRQGQEKWDPNSRIFIEETNFSDVINLECDHRCRVQPVEATIYSLEAEGQDLKKFRGTSRTELTVEVEESSEQEKKKTEHCLLELPVDVRKEDEKTRPPIHRVKVDTSERFRRGKIEEMVKLAEFDKLPSGVTDREIARLAPLFSPSTLETVALQHFGVSEAQANSLKTENIHNTEGFKRSLLTRIRNRPSHTREDLYRILLEAESEGILRDVDMFAVDKLILRRESERKPSMINLVFVDNHF